MKKYMTNGEGFKRPVIEFIREEDSADDIIDCYMHLEELQEGRNNKYYKKKLKFYIDKYKKHGYVGKR